MTALVLVYRGRRQHSGLDQDLPRLAKQTARKKGRNAFSTWASTFAGLL